MGKFSCKLYANQKRGKIYIFLWTFAIYSAFRVARKSISVVKSVLHPNCSEKILKHGALVADKNKLVCGWSPFGTKKTM